MDTDGWMDGKVVILIHSWPPLIYAMSTGQCVQTHPPPLNVHNGVGTEKMGKGDEGIGGYGTERNKTELIIDGTSFGAQGRINHHSGRRCVGGCIGWWQSALPMMKWVF